MACKLRISMLQYAIVCIIYLISTLFISLNSFAFSSEKEIAEIYIEASGNNKHEAKIKAHKQGMQRALFLLADRLNISTDSMSLVNYEALKEVFKPIVVNNELSSKDKYSATVTYSYSQGKFYNLLLQYGDEKVDDLFYEYLVIPAFKQGSFFNVWDPDKRWNSYWEEARKMLDSHKIYYPKKTVYTAKKITPENLMDLKYDDFLEIFKGQLFKGVMIVTAEFFTNRHTRESIIRVNTRIMPADGSEPEMLKVDFPLNEMEDVAYTVDLVIDRIIDDYGMLRSIQFDQATQDLFIEDEEEQKPIIMNFDVYDPDELDTVRDKLESVAQIDNFRIEHDYNTRYKILIYTNATEYELAEGLYLNGLSYKIHGKLYNLIDIKKGG